MSGLFTQYDAITINVLNELYRIYLDRNLVRGIGRVLKNAFYYFFLMNILIAATH